MLVYGRDVCKASSLFALSLLSAAIAMLMLAWQTGDDDGLACYVQERTKRVISSVTATFDLGSAVNSLIHLNAPTDVLAASVNAAEVFQDLRNFTPACEYLEAGVVSLEAAYDEASILNGCKGLKLNWLQQKLGVLVLFSMRHALGQWYGSQQPSLPDPEAPPDAALRAAVRRAYSYTVGLASEILHGMLWHLMLRQSTALERAGLSFDVSLFAEEYCCKACEGPGCNAACAISEEGDFYHHCFHGVGHGLALLHLARADASTLQTYAACSGSLPLSLPPHPRALARAEAECAQLAERWRPNRRACYTGVYMHYFELLRVDAAVWAGACEQARCRAACIIKCREFGRYFFPGTGVCYGVAEGNARVRQLDMRFDPAQAQAASSSFYTPEAEAMLVPAGSVGAGCFS